LWNIPNTTFAPHRCGRALIPQERDTGSQERCGEGISSRPLWHDTCIGMHLCTDDIVAGRTPSKLSRGVHTTRCKIRLCHHAHTRGDLPNGRISGTNGRISGTNGLIFREQHQLADVVGALHELVCTGCLRQWQVLGDCWANSTAPEQLQQPLQLHARARVYPEDTRAASRSGAGEGCASRLLRNPYSRSRSPLRRRAQLWGRSPELRSRAPLCSHCSSTSTNMSTSQSAWERTPGTSEPVQAKRAPHSSPAVSGEK
jgi:hypothetical protein